MPLPFVPSRHSSGAVQAALGQRAAMRQEMLAGLCAAVGFAHARLVEAVDPDAPEPPEPRSFGQMVEALVRIDELHERAKAKHAAAFWGLTA